MGLDQPDFSNLGSGFDGKTPPGGNSPADSIFDQVLPNAVVARSSELFALARKSSLWTLSFGLACCAIEMMSAHMSHHDLDRFGVVTWALPQAGRRDDRCRHRGQEDGRSHNSPVRADARPEMGNRDGKLRHQWRALLSIVFGSHGSRPPGPGRTCTFLAARPARKR